MTLKDIKTAINGRIIENGYSVYSNETDESYEKPAFFVEVVPVKTTRINLLYQEIALSVIIQYEPLIETEEECFDKSQLIDKWFSTPIELNDADKRVLKPPEEIEHTTDEDKTLFSSFTITTTRIYNEDAYSDEDRDLLMQELDVTI